MPTLDDNRAFWSGYDWAERGDEWSGPFGGSDLLWHGTLLPRLRRLLPAGRALELTPGFGRVTRHLKDHCGRLVLVDLSAECVAACRGRFAAEPHLEFHQNDGRSLPMIADGSLDLVFSWDSLVHVEGEVMDAYVAECARVLAPGGWGWIHHSNLGAHASAAGGLPFENRWSRGVTMSADRFVARCREFGLACAVQELVPWGCGPLIDCISVFRKGGDSLPLRRVENWTFNVGVHYHRSIAQLYDPAVAVEDPLWDLPGVRFLFAGRVEPGHRTDDA